MEEFEKKYMSNFKKSEQDKPLFIKMNREFIKKNKEEQIAKAEILQKVRESHKTLDEMNIPEHEKKFFEEQKKHQEERKK